MEPMSNLCSLFESIACFGEILGRAEEKDQEVATLSATVESVSASVKTFLADLLPEERAPTFYSNTVFPQMLKQVKLCEVVAQKRYDAIEQAEKAQAQLTDQASEHGVFAAFRRGMSSMRSFRREASEALSGKLSSISGVLKLPEDELAVIRSANTELQRLLPLLTLAMTAHTSRGRKRLSVSGRSYVEPEADAKRLRALEDTDWPSSSTCSTAHAPSQLSGTNLVLQLVSDYSPARAVTLPALFVSDLRTASGSSASLGSATGSEPGCAVDTMQNKRLFGRQELRNRVPVPFTLPAQNGTPAQPFSRFVSRDLFELEDRIKTVVPLPASLELPTQVMGSDAFDPTTSELTEVMGGEVPDDSDNYNTLPMPGLAAGGFAEDNSGSSNVLATAKCLSKTGLHCRSNGHSIWRWVGPNHETELRAGDRIALLLESPRGSYTPGPQQDLEADEVTCLLGVEFRL